jgi:hypothetical protein
LDVCRDDIPCSAGQRCEAGACIDAPPDDVEDDELDRASAAMPFGCAGSGSDFSPATLALCGLALWRRRRKPRPAERDRKRHRDAGF